MAIKIIYFTFLFGICFAKQPFELKDFLDNNFAPNEWNGTWISDNELIFKAKNGDYKIFLADKNETKTYIVGNKLDEFKNASITVSADKKYLLIKYEPKSVFRHSTLAKYALYNVTANKVSYVHTKNEFLKLCFWAPKDNSFAYVKDNNIYYFNITTETKTEVVGTQITTNGNPSVYVGVTDWIYEEEVFSNNKAIWFSPDGKYLAYAVFDDTNVPEFTYELYKNLAYPEKETLRYPKVGFTNPKVSVFVKKLGYTKVPEEVKLKSSPIEILQSVNWYNNSMFHVLTKNRRQNEYWHETCNITDTNPIKMTCVTNATKVETKGWSDMKLHPECGTFGPRVEAINKMKIDEFLGCNDTKMYFAGSILEKPYEQQIYVTKNNSYADCLSCNWKTPEGPCKFSEATFSNNSSYAAFICKGPGPTYIEIRNLQKNTSYSWENNTEIRKKLQDKILPEIKDLKVNITKTLQADVRLLLPNIDYNKTYPLIIHVYAGPNSNQIKETFSIGYQHYLVTKREYIYGYIDGRGSGRRGPEMLFEIFKKLGTVEITDQINVTRELKKMYGFIDPNRVCIWGWSYGGFATAMALTDPTNDVFKCGISVAPVTNFKFYDSIYTERYMGLETENVEGYKKTDLTTRVDKLRGKRYFLIHGNADDNVHYQQAMTFARAIELAGIPFQLMSYPDENHALKGVFPHLYHAMDQFWGENFNKTGKSGQGRTAAITTWMSFISILCVILFNLQLKNC